MSNPPRKPMISTLSVNFGLRSHASEIAAMSSRQSDRTIRVGWLSIAVKHEKDGARPDAQFPGQGPTRNLLLLQTSSHSPFTLAL
jgi:hypothetical protein